MADLILYPFFLSLILTLLYVTWRLIIRDTHQNPSGGSEQCDSKDDQHIQDHPDRSTAFCGCIFSGQSPVT
jgi:hypothetical protein